MKNQHTNHLSELIFGTLLMSTSGALGRFIDMPSPVTIWWRCALGFLFLLAYCKIKNISLNVNSRSDLRTFILSSLFLGAHWITYFYSLKLSNVAIGMLSLYTFPVITALLEPLFIRVKLDPIHLLLGMVVLFGVYILAPEFNLNSHLLKGVVLGLISAVFYSMRTLILKRHIQNYHATKLMLYQLGILSLVLLPILFFMDTSGIKTQFPYVLILALVTTAIAHTIFVNSLNHFSVSTASIVSSVQPVFGIIIAYLFLKEIPTFNTFLGGALILSTVIIESIRSGKT